MMKPLHLLVICVLTLAAAHARAEDCLNTDSKRGSYAAGDSRNSTYVRCKPGEGSGSYGSVNAIGAQLQNIIDQRKAEESAEDAAYRAERDRNWQNGGKEDERNTFKVLKYAMASEVSYILRSIQGLQRFPNAEISPEQQQQVRQEINDSIQNGRLLEQFGSLAFEQQSAWVSGSDPVKNWKVCEVATQLVRAYVFGDLIKPEQKNPAKGFAIARVGCSASCGGTCYWLGRIFEEGDKAAPGVDAVLGETPASHIRTAYDKAIFNGVPGAYEREAGVNWHMPERYKEKTYWERDGISLTKSNYWYVNGSTVRLAYRQYQRCLLTEPGNLGCARSINALIKEYKIDSPYRNSSSEYSPDADIRREIDFKDIAYYQAYLTKLESFLANPSEATAAVTGLTPQAGEIKAMNSALSKPTQKTNKLPMQYGTAVELTYGPEAVAKHQFKGGDISEAQQQSIRAEVIASINAGTLLATYGGVDYADDSSANSPWLRTDPAQKWKACEVASVLTVAYAFGNFIKPEQMNPAKGLAIAIAGTKNFCGGTAYHLGRMYESGDSLVAGVDKILGTSPREAIQNAYDIAILNGVGAAYERAAETNVQVLARYRDKVIPVAVKSDRIQYWPAPQADQYELAKIQYRKCVEYQYNNLNCARGLRDIYSQTAGAQASQNYNKELSTYYADYVRKLEVK